MGRANRPDPPKTGALGAVGRQEDFRAIRHGRSKKFDAAAIHGGLEPPLGVPGDHWAMKMKAASASTMSLAFALVRSRISFVARSPV